MSRTCTNSFTLWRSFQIILGWRVLAEKILQTQGFGSKKFCQQLIKDGHVSFNGEICTQLKTQISTTNLSFSVYGEAFDYHEKVYIALNKAAGFECSHQTTHHHSVFSLFPDYLLNRGIQCVGRLDQDTTGLILFTDDGQFLQASTHPKKHVPKRYRMHTADAINDEQINQLRLGVELRNEQGIFAATEVQQVDSHVLEMTIHQGIYHQVKRMLAAVGNKVEQLERVSIGQLQLADLDLGENEWRYLNADQVQAAKMRDDV